jgi:hypothetical protein
MPQITTSFSKQNRAAANQRLSSMICTTQGLMGSIKREIATSCLSLFAAVSGNTITVRQAESKQFSKNMDHLRPFKASF